MEQLTHEEYVWPLPNGKRFHFAGDKADAEFIDAAFKDAERYRKLIASGKYCAASMGGAWGLSCGNGGHVSKAELDAAADAL